MGATDVGVAVMDKVLGGEMATLICSFTESLK